MRRFHAYNVGLPRSGTMSVAEIFDGYRTAHEFRMDEAVVDVTDHASGRLSRADFVSRTLARDREGGLEMNSSSYNHFFVDILLERFPQARFVFTLRDCWSWLESLLFLFDALRPLPPGLARHAREAMKIPLRDSAHGIALGDSLTAGVEELAGPALAFWARANQRVLDLLPADRSLILRTSEISRSLPLLASLVGVPLDTLKAERAHLHASPPHKAFLHLVGAARLETEARDAGCEFLMRRYFPAENAALFLERNAFLAQFRGPR